MQNFQGFGLNSVLAQSLARSKNVLLPVDLGVSPRYDRLTHSVRALQRNVLRFVGFRRVRATLIGGVGTMSPDERSECLARVRSLGTKAA